MKLNRVELEKVAAFLKKLETASYDEGVVLSEGRIYVVGSANSVGRLDECDGDYFLGVDG